MSCAEGPWLRRPARPRCCCLPLVATLPRSQPATPGAPTANAALASIISDDLSASPALAAPASTATASAPPARCLAHVNVPA